MEFFITLAIVLGLIVVPALLNYLVNRYCAPAGQPLGPRFEQLAASFVLTFAILVMDILVVLVLSLGWEALEEEIADFVKLGLLDFARERPIALTRVLTAFAMMCMAVMTVLGVLRIPGRYVR